MQSKISAFFSSKTFSFALSFSMYSPTRKVRASIRRTILLLLIGFVSTLLIVETAIEIGDAPYLPTESAALMLNRSQMLLARETRLEPTRFTCHAKGEDTPIYPLFIVVKTRAIGSGGFFQRRLFTRTTWAKEAHARGIPVIYAVGLSEDKITQKQLEQEHRIYGDILQINYIDAYYNNTIKTTGILNWFVKRGCQHVTSYLFIVDDDILLNLPRFTQMFTTNSFQADTMYGLFLPNIEPHPSGRWAVSLRDFPNATYPDFLIGASILYPTNVLPKIVDKVFELVEQNQPILFLDDVFVTGIIAQQLQLKRAPLIGIQDCSYTDLYSCTLINECSTVRRTYVWSKYVLKRIHKNADIIDHLINSTTIYNKWNPNFKQMRNGTAIIQLNQYDRSKFVFILIFILLFLVISICFLRKQSTSSTSIDRQLLIAPSTSPPMKSSRLLAPVKV